MQVSEIWIAVCDRGSDPLPLTRLVSADLFWEVCGGTGHLDLATNAGLRRVGPPMVTSSPTAPVESILDRAILAVMRQTGILTS